MTRTVWLLAGLLGSGLSFAQPSDALFAATLTGLDNQPVALEKWKGQPLIVNFWARWCGPCKVEIPELIELRRQYRTRGLEVVGIALEDKAEPVRDFAKAYEMDYPILLARDKGLDLMKALGNAKMGVPFTLAIDRGGNIVRLKLGGIKGEELVAAAEDALKP